MTDMTATATTISPRASDTPVTTRRSPGSRTWRTIGAVLALAALAWGTISVIGLLAHEERTEVTSFDADALDAVDVRNGAGSVSVIGVDGVDTVTVTAEISEGLRSTGDRQQIVGRTLELRGSCPVLGNEWCDVRYTVEVPRDTQVIASSDDGRITVRHIDGTVELDADNGTVEVSDVAGALTADNDNGRITATGLRSPTVIAATDNGSVELTFATAPTGVEARSNNGRVEVVVPDTSDAYRLDISTGNGDVENALRTDPASERSITVASDNGDVIARPAG